MIYTDELLRHMNRCRCPHTHTSVHVCIWSNTRAPAADEEMRHIHGETLGDEKFLRLKQSVMNAMLHVVYCVKAVWEQREIWDVEMQKVTFISLRVHVYGKR
jgi:hypothetical protein